jgi:hypothetical protein
MHAEASKGEPFSHSSTYNGKYLEIGIRVNRAEALENFVSQMVSELKEAGVPIKDAGVSFRNPWSHGDEWIYNGFVSINLELPIPKSLEGNPELGGWKRNIAKIVDESEETKSINGIRSLIGNNGNYASIHFEESSLSKIASYSLPQKGELSEETFYGLTPYKEKVIREGFETLKNFWAKYSKAVQSYDQMFSDYWANVQRTF